MYSDIGPSRSVFTRAKAGLAAAVLWGLALTGATSATATGTPVSVTASAAGLRSQTADLGAHAVSADTKLMADWVVSSDDNRDLPFIIVDKASARLVLFDARGRIDATAPVLLGMARGDDSPPGVGDKPLASITPAERITPAGRFVAEPGVNMAGQDIVWIDFGAAVSLHRASDRKPGMAAKSRVDRLDTPTVLDNRVSLGCVNVSTEFFDGYVRAFGRAAGIIYILPETRTARAEFHIPMATELARR